MAHLLVRKIVVLVEWDEVEKARQFASSDDPRQSDERAGVPGRPGVLLPDEVEVLAE